VLLIDLRWDDMTTTLQQADDDFDALEALESEEKKYLKVSPSLPHCFIDRL
jgi:hypothetical protein